MEKYIFLYFAIISLITAVITVYDKLAAKKFPRNRVPEKVLFALAFCGGSLGEFITMLIIRHKTKHVKFMVGLPVILVIHIVLILVILNLLGNIN